MRLKHREISRQLQELITRAQGLERDCETFCYRANTDMDDGISGVSYGGNGRGSGHSDPVGRRIEVGRRDQVADAAKTLVRAINEALRAVKQADKAGFSLLALSETEAQALTNDEVAHHAEEQTLSATCANPACRRPVARSKNDPLKAGRCQACYMHWYRSGFNEERPRHLCALDSRVGIASSDGLGLDDSRLIVAEEVA